MTKISRFKKPIPISVALSTTLEEENVQPRYSQNKLRIVTISLLAVAIATGISFIAKFLILLINLVTNLSFYGTISVADSTPMENSLGLWVIIVPALGGLIVGFMALYGSKAIRGHGIPEAMEQILTNQSKIKPTITYLKPISSAIAIGTGGPFGAEGPIIATGGALGSTIGQLLKITHHERKILLAAGATAGMAAIFGSPIAAIFLAIELLLFEFSPRSIIPVALACITGAAGHHFLFGTEPVFAILSKMEAPSNSALFSYSMMGILMGVVSVGVTKIVYKIEDLFEKLPIHWMWWPAIGGLIVGLVGYFHPRTLGVGYHNITEVLSGNLSLSVVAALCIWKFVSWAIALGSGTSGGTLAPLLTIGGALGALMGMAIQHLFPDAGIQLSLAALVGMSAMFAGASRALLTSIIFALETTGQSNALLPLLAACTAAYFISFFLMENTIMTEKIVRRGVRTPDSFEPDVLEKITVAEVMKDDAVVLNDETTIAEVRDWLVQQPLQQANYFIIVNNESVYKGIVSVSNLMSLQHDTDRLVGTLIKRKQISVQSNSTLKEAVEKMATENVDVLPILSEDLQVVGVLNYKNIISAYKPGMDDHVKKQPHISIKKQGLKMLIRGQRLMQMVRKK